MSSPMNPELFDILTKKGQLIDLVYNNTVSSIELIKKVIDDLLKE